MRKSLFQSHLIPEFTHTYQIRNRLPEAMMSYQGLGRARLNLSIACLIGNHVLLTEIKPTICRSKEPILLADVGLGLESTRQMTSFFQ